jgi:hypothetical protein
LKNRVLRRICGPKKGKVRGEWRSLDKEKFNDLRSPPNIISVMKSRKMRWTGLVARVGGEVNTEFWWGTPKEKRIFGNPGVVGRIILKWIFGSGMGHGRD